MTPDSIRLSTLQNISAANPQALTRTEKNLVLAEALRRRGIEVTTDEVLTEAVVNDYDPDDDLSAYSLGSRYVTQLTGDLKKKRYAKRKELHPHVRERAHKVAAELWDGSPLARRFTERLVNYCLGEGIRITAQHQDQETRAKIQAVLDGFWNDPRNRLNRRFYSWMLAYRTYGELCLRAAVNPVNGLVRLAFIGADRIVDVRTEDYDIEQITQVWVKRPADDVDTDPEPLDYVRAVENPYAPRDLDARLQGEVFYWGANKLPDMVRGRPSQLVSADYIDADDQLIWTLLERAAMANSWVWDVTIEGGTTDEIKEFQKRHGGAPRPGSLQVHNERVKFAPLTATVPVTETAVEHDLLMNVVAISHGMPPMWFTSAQDPNRANGETLTGPTLKDLTAYQREMAAIAEDLCAFQVDQAVLAGVLPEHVRGYDAFEVEMPDLSVNDLAAASQTLGQFMAAASSGMQAGVVPKEAVIRGVSLILAQLGVEMDVEHLYAALNTEAGQAEPPPGQDPYGLGVQDPLAMTDGAPENLGIPEEPFEDADWSDVGMPPPMGHQPADAALFGRVGPRPSGGFESRPDGSTRTILAR